MLRERGFTLIELMIVVAIVAIIAAIAIPNLLSARKAANEAAAIGTLRSIAAAQQIFHERDVEKDGFHDYGSVIELRTARLIALELVNAGGPIVPYASGYYFQQWPRAGFTNEWGFLVTAIPVSRGRSGDRAFAIVETGVIYYDWNAHPIVAFSADPTTQWLPLE